LGYRQAEQRDSGGFGEIRGGVRLGDRFCLWIGNPWRAGKTVSWETAICRRGYLAPSGGQFGGKRPGYARPGRSGTEVGLEFRGELEPSLRSNSETLQNPRQIVRDGAGFVITYRPSSPVDQFRVVWEVEGQPPWGCPRVERRRRDTVRSAGSVPEQAGYLRGWRRTPKRSTGRECAAGWRGDPRPRGCRRWRRVRG
jgi:hypothetical protein